MATRSVDLTATPVEVPLLRGQWYQLQNAVPATTRVQFAVADAGDAAPDIGAAAFALDARQPAARVRLATGQRLFAWVHAAPDGTDPRAGDPAEGALVYDLAAD